MIPCQAEWPSMNRCMSLCTSRKSVFSTKIPLISHIIIAMLWSTRISLHIPGLTANGWFMYGGTRVMWAPIGPVIDSSFKHL